LLVAIIVAASAVVFSQIASAADLPVKAPAYVPPSPAYSWTGLYIGGNVGYS
jgi:outer membrane immunogenic protein